VDAFVCRVREAEGEGSANIVSADRYRQRALWFAFGIASGLGPLELLDWTYEPPADLKRFSFTVRASNCYCEYHSVALGSKMVVHCTRLKGFTVDLLGEYPHCLVFVQPLEGLQPEGRRRNCSLLASPYQKDL
jgi:hypothetical protein